MPDCKAEAESRDQALSLIQQRLEEFLRRSEIVQLQIPHLGKKLGKTERSEKRNGQTLIKTKAAKQPKLVRFPPMILASDKSVHLETPWEYFGIFKDDPTWMPMLEKIERERDRNVVYPKKKKKGKV
jgi:hypothetical protein